jgi:hypothetical protein
MVASTPHLQLFEVWQNLAIFGGRPIGGAVEALFNKVVDQRLLVLPIVVFLLPPAVRTADSMIVVQ